ncbi:hypothetical protein GCM10010435_29030 [Winogradskya consettensis]|uniref:Uncharacterized protein n=1 Tax=Winogradskya consettensis TaxID=113560 RepID=A0A919SH01_9ACTN|nr:hypothetical protein [Actinoplanes consettensis]GIM70853.1 hypothetical protein Aco04nite_22470 [Actinoplanes consettensis]
MAFEDDLADWTHWDGAAFRLGRALGLFTDRGFTESKWVFWTANPLGDGLHEALLALVQAGVLDRREEPDDEQFRWHSPDA